jgi:hypothetical protein
MRLKTETQDPALIGSLNSATAQIIRIPSVVRLTKTPFDLVFAHPHRYIGNAPSEFLPTNFSIRNSLLAPVATTCHAAETRQQAQECAGSHAISLAV